MKSKATFYHAGCAVCVAAEQALAQALDPQAYEVEVVHLGQQAGRVDEARNLGVQSVPALLLDEQVFHINFGAALSDLS